MSAHPLIEKITSEAEMAVSLIRERTDASLVAVNEEGKSAIAELEKEYALRLEKEMRHRELLALSQARQENTLTLQTARRKEIDAIFDDALAVLSQLPKTDYVALYTALYKETVPKTITVTEVRAPSSRQAETKDILAEVGVKAPVSSDETISSGLVVETADGLFDLTLSRLFAQKRPELEMLAVTNLS